LCCKCCIISLWFWFWSFCTSDFDVDFKSLSSSVILIWNHFISDLSQHCRFPRPHLLTWKIFPAMLLLLVKDQLSSLICIVFKLHRRYKLTMDGSPLHFESLGLYVAPTPSEQCFTGLWAFHKVDTDCTVAITSVNVGPISI